MPSVSIDAGVLAVPPVDCEIEEAHRYVDTISDWSRLLNEPWVSIYMSERSSETLIKEGLFPLHDQLEELFTAHGIEEFAVNGVVRVVNTLLQMTPSFETYYRMQEVLTRLEDVTTNPDLLQLCASMGFQTELARCIILIAILRKHCTEPILDHSLIIRSAPRQIVNVTALIHDIQHERDDLTEIPSPPNYFEGDVLVCDDFHGLIQCLDASAILLSAVDDVGLEAAIRVALYKSRIARSQEPNWDDTRGLIIGHSFRETLRECCVDQADSFAAKVLRSIIDTLEGLNMRATHRLRTGQGANDPQRTRGLDNAWRRDIDYEYHLHYWQCEDGNIELGSVVVHKDMTIPE